jgi:tRNA pseudouridine65 synthase
MKSLANHAGMPIFTPKMQFPILFEDAYFVAIQKPSGILVHRTGISEDKIFVLQELRNQLGRHVFPVHRLDRGTSGVLLFAFDSKSAAALQSALESPISVKTYLAIVRGWLPDEGSIDVSLEKDGTGELQEALTSYRCLARATLQVPVDRYATARYSLVAIRLHTGRMHQIRRHFAHERHPVLSDFKRGDRHHNHMWEREFGMTTMQLLAWRLHFEHPFTGEAMDLEASPEDTMLQACKILGWDLAEYAHFCWT